MKTQRLLELAGVQSTDTLTEMKKPVVGKQFGTTDQAPPEDYTPAQLSRIADMLYAAFKFGGKVTMKRAFSLVPDDAKGEWNYSNWKYEAEK